MPTPDAATAQWQQAWSIGTAICAATLMVVFIALAIAIRKRAATNPHQNPDPIPPAPTIAAATFLALWATATAAGLATIATSHNKLWDQMQRTRTTPTTVEVVGMQYQWAFRLPGPDGQFTPADPQLRSPENPFGLTFQQEATTDDIITFGTVETTAGLDVTFRVRTLDVIHSFYLPEFRNQVNTLPGRTAHFRAQPTQPGTYRIACNQFCGLGHYRMNAQWHVVPEN